MAEVSALNHLPSTLAHPLCASVGRRPAAIAGRWTGRPWYTGQCFFRDFKSLYGRSLGSEQSLSCGRKIPNVQVH